MHGGPGTEDMLKYSRYGADYDRVLENVRRLLAMRNAAGATYPKVQLKAILFNWNDTDEAMDRFRADARSLGLVASPARDTDKYYWVLDGNPDALERRSLRFTRGSAVLQRLIDANELE